MLAPVALAGAVRATPDLPFVRTGRGLKQLRLGPLGLALVFIVAAALVAVGHVREHRHVAPVAVLPPLVLVVPPSTGGRKGGLPLSTVKWLPGLPLRHGRLDARRVVLALLEARKQRFSFGRVVVTPLRPSTRVFWLATLHPRVLSPWLLLIVVLQPFRLPARLAPRSVVSTPLLTLRVFVLSLPSWRKRAPLPLAPLAH